MSNPWFRMYSEFSHDPKVQMLSEAMQRRYIMVMCMRCSNALVTLHEKEIAFHLRITEQELAETKALFVSKGFIDSDWNLLNWEKRQMPSDTSNARVAKHRALSKAKQEDACNVTEPLPKQEGNALEEIRVDKKRVDKKNTATAVAPPDGVSQKVWADFLKTRKTKVTDTAIDGIRREADKAGISLETALETSCARGWQSFRAEWMREGVNATKTPISFKQSDDDIGMARWEEMTGRTHPDRRTGGRAPKNVIDITPKFTEIGT